MIEVRDIDSFYGKAQILNNVGFSINAGEVVSYWVATGQAKQRR